MKIRGRGSRIGVVLAALLASGAVAAAGSTPCVGRCEDGAGNAMTVERPCDDVAERCVAGCDTSGGRSVPYAECEATGRAAVVPPPAENPGGVRVRDGD